jgi:glyoxylase-like metal-dependent hydrolase (beta-lactamase superfamily II)
VTEQPTRTPPARLTYPFPDAPPFGERLEVAPGVFWVSRPLSFSLARINIWLIRDGDGWTLVDTGMGDKPTLDLWENADAILEGRPIKRIICTHMHPDHIGCAGVLSRRFDAPLHMTALEYITARVLVADTGRAAPEEGVRFYRGAGWGEEALEAYRKRFGGFGRMVTPMPEAYVRMREGDEIEIGGQMWRVVLGYGHSPEHACLWNPTAKLCISGDQIIPRISSNVSVYPTEPDGDPLGGWLQSCAKLLEMLPNDTLILPAHNEPFYGVTQRLEYLIAGHGRTLERVYSRLTEPRRAVDLFGAMFARDISNDQDALATGETIAHLHRLMAQGRVKRTMDGNGVWHYQQA